MTPSSIMYLAAKPAAIPTDTISETIPAIIERPSSRAGSSIAPGAWVSEGMVTSATVSPTTIHDAPIREDRDLEIASARGWTNLKASR